MSTLDINKEGQLFRLKLTKPAFDLNADTDPRRQEKVIRIRISEAFIGDE